MGEKEESVSSQSAICIRDFVETERVVHQVDVETKRYEPGNYKTRGLGTDSDAGTPTLFSEQLKNSCSRSASQNLI